MFVIQIHGLPLVYLHEGTTKMVGNKIGEIHHDSIKCRCVMAHRFLNFKVNIDVNNQISVGFIEEKV